MCWGYAMIAKNNSSFLSRFTPFMAWLPDLKRPAVLRADISAGITVALVLIPQSMAYAQLAGLPPYYGLYAAFLPPIIASLFGSSRQLSTGPVAIVSLLTAAALEPIATAGTDSYIAYAILMALIVGLIQLLLGLLKLGVIINFLSHPVILGFTNAAAIIIASSQLDKIFGVTVEKSSFHYETIWRVIAAAVADTHMPTFLIAVFSFLVMIGLRRYAPRWPNVLIAVVATTILSYSIGFEQRISIKPSLIHDQQLVTLIHNQISQQNDAVRLTLKIKEAELFYNEMHMAHGAYHDKVLRAYDTFANLKRQMKEIMLHASNDLAQIRSIHLEHVVARNSQFYIKGSAPKGARTDGRIWHIRQITDSDTLVLYSGGQVVGHIPAGLPSFRLPQIDLGMFTHLFLSAAVIALIGFMETVSIARAMATRTRQHLDVNQELVGQGLGNIVGSYFQSYAVSGSFSRSAVNISVGAITGFSSVATGIVVICTLLWLTTVLYYLPQATLAAVIMLAVIGLVNIRAMRRIWNMHHSDGIVAISSFIMTLVFAPHLEYAILFGVILSLSLFLYRSMRPYVAELARYSDGNLHDAKVYSLNTCDNISILRFDGLLYFANISYFEDKIMDVMVQKPDLRYLVIDGASISQIDSSAIEFIESISQMLREHNIEIFFSHLNHHVMHVMSQAGLILRLGDDHFYRDNEQILHVLWNSMGADHAFNCPLNIVCPAEKKS